MIKKETTDGRLFLWVIGQKVLLLMPMELVKY